MLFINQTACKAMALLMHFFFTALFAWYAIDLYSLHNMSGHHQGDKSKIPLYCCIGWGNGCSYYISRIVYVDEHFFEQGYLY
jgi:hypothetical protein